MIFMFNPSKLWNGNMEKIVFLLTFLFFISCRCDDELRKGPKTRKSLFASVHHLMTEPEKLLLFGHESTGSEYEVFEPSNWSKIRSNLHYLNHKKRQKLKEHSNKLKEVKFNEKEADGDIKLNSDQRKRRRKRSATEYINYGDNRRIKEYPSKLRIKFTAFDEQFDLILKQNDNLFSNDFSILEEKEENVYTQNKTSFDFKFDSKLKSSNNIFSSDKIELNNCYYQGYCILHPNSSAAISMCEGMRGLIETTKAIYVINPLPGGVISKYHEVNNGSKHNDISHPHVIVKKAPNDQYSCPHRRSPISNQTTSLLYSDVVKSLLPSPDHESNFLSSQVNHQVQSQGRRIKRSLSNEFPEEEDTDSIGNSGSKVGVTVETAVFVDETLYEIMRRTYPADTEQEIVTYILTIMNAVQLLFKQASLGRDVSISVILMDILKIQPRDLISSDNIDTYLTNFCVWQHNKRINSRGLTPRWDHALLLSGINMYVVDGQGRKKRHVVGLAPVSGMCNSLNSCTISEGTSFQTVLVAGHEMGHSLGMEHDGPQDGNSCDQNDFIMSPTLGAGKTSWSSCSKRQNKLPGQIFDGDQQCALRFGSDSRRSSIQKIEDVCRLLRCDTGSKRNTIVYHAHPALEGTSCGPSKWCREGSCIDMDPDPDRDRVVMHATASDLNSIEKKKEDIASIDGRWSSWSSWTPCSSECIIRSDHSATIGISWSTRKCNTPSPLNGGKLCDGNDKMAKLCDASQLCLSSPVYKMVTTSEYIDDVCRVASKRDSNLEPRGTQYPSYDRSHSCYVWCHKKGGGFMTQGWKLPDGTPCGRETYRRSLSSANRFCVNGECRAFDCDGINHEKSPTEACPVPFSVTQSSHSLESRSNEKMIMKNTNVWGPWMPLTSCHFPCLINGRGIKLITRECNLVGSCHGMKDWFQLCPKTEDTCLAEKVKSANEYANDLCHKYRYRYPTLLSGRGRQLSPRNGNPNAACIVACQDRVWRDIHYQMDAFEDGKFPLGTDCSYSSRSGNGQQQQQQPAYCVDGKCIKFDENDLPIETNIETITQVKSFLHREFRYLNRHRRSTPTNPFVHKKAPIQDAQFYGQRIVNPTNRGIPNWKPVRSFRPARFESPIEDTSNSSDILRLQTYSWGMSMSECSSPCDTGQQNVQVYCHSGHLIVEDKYCSDSPKPAQSGIRTCNQHKCTGSWRVEDWSQCSIPCGSGYRTRAVICVQKTDHDNVFSLKNSECSRREKPSSFESCYQHCPQNKNGTTDIAGAL